jgi:hypothetical protein
MAALALESVSQSDGTSSANGVFGCLLDEGEVTREKDMTRNMTLLFRASGLKWPPEAESVSLHRFGEIISALERFGSDAASRKIESFLCNDRW